MTTGPPPKMIVPAIIMFEKNCLSAMNFHTLNVLKYVGLVADGRFTHI
jgi:hypothetical protein